MSYKPYINIDKIKNFIQDTHPGAECLSKEYVVNKKILVRCEQKHPPWEIAWGNLRCGKWCPYCCNKKILEENCLLKTHPLIEEEWHPTKNEGKIPSQFWEGSREVVWWVCSIGHDYQCSIAKRCRLNHDCNHMDCSKKILNTEHFIKKAKLIHPEYEYDKTIFSGIDNKTTVFCKKEGHGDFKITPRSLLEGAGCPKLGCFKNAKSNTEHFIQRMLLIRPYYKYDKIIYVNRKVKVEIGCYIDDHGYWFSTPRDLLYGYGCPKCQNSFGEDITREIFNILFKNYFIKVKPDFLKNPETNKNFELDGFCEDLMLAFEYQGRQHEEIVSKYNMTQEDLDRIKKRDLYKKQKCDEQGIVLLQIPQFNKKFKPENLKDFIHNKLTELGIKLPEDFDNIQIDINEIKKKIQFKSIEIRECCS